MAKSATRGWSSTRSGAPEPPEERRHRRAEPDHAHHDELAEGLEEAALRGHGRRAAEHESGQAVLGHLVAGLVGLLQRLRQRVGVELLVALHVAAVLEVEDREPAAIAAHQRVMIVARRVAVELEEAPRVGRVEEGLALVELERGDLAD